MTPQDHERLWPIAAVLAGSVLAAVGLVFGAALAAPADKPPRWLAARYGDAVASFRQARFPEAYGRFIAVAELGYAPAARHALWMCENGQELLGAHFDCAPHEIEGWAAMAGANPREALQRIHPGHASPPAPRARP